MCKLSSLLSLGIVCIERSLLSNFVSNACRFFVLQLDVYEVVKFQKCFACSADPELVVDGSELAASQDAVCSVIAPLCLSARQHLARRTFLARRNHMAYSHGLRHITFWLKGHHEHCSFLSVPKCVTIRTVELFSQRGTSSDHHVPQAERTVELQPIAYSAIPQGRAGLAEWLIHSLVQVRSPTWSSETSLRLRAVIRHDHHPARYLLQHA